MNPGSLVLVLVPEEFANCYVRVLLFVPEAFAGKGWSVCAISSLMQLSFSRILAFPHRLSEVARRKSLRVIVVDLGSQRDDGGCVLHGS